MESVKVQPVHHILRVRSEGTLLRMYRIIYKGNGEESRGTRTRGRHQTVFHPFGTF